MARAPVRSSQFPAEELRLQLGVLSDTSLESLMLHRRRLCQEGWEMTDTVFLLSRVPAGGEPSTCEVLGWELLCPGDRQLLTAIDDESQRR